MLSLSSSVTAVTVFRQGAVVTRQVELVQPANGWPNQLRLGGLPLCLADQSLRIRSSFPQGGGGLLATDLRVELDWEEPQAVPPARDEDLLPWQTELRRLRSRVLYLNQDLVRLEAMQPATRATAPGQPPPPYPLQSRRALVELRQKLLSEGMEQRTQLTRQIEELEKKLRLATTPPPPVPLPPLFKAVVVTLRSQPEAHAAAVCLHLSYEVAGARWAPSYTLRFDRDFTMAELSMRALLCQSSGEDWRGVQLQVSTADMAAWKELPELPSRRIGRQQLRPHKPGWRPAPPNTDALFEDYDRKPSTRPLEAPMAVSFGVIEGPPAFPEPATRWPAEDMLMEQADPFCAPSADPFASASDPFAGGGDPFGAPHADPFGAPQAFGSAQADPFATRSVPAPSLGSAPPAGRSGLMARGSASKAQASRTVIQPGPPGGKPILSRERSMPSEAGPPRQPARPSSAPARGRGWEPVEPPALELSADQLAYALLYMPAADERGRGRLQPRSATEACLQLWVERYPQQPFNARGLIEEALHASRRALSVQAPRQHSFPRSLSGFDYLYVGESPVDLDSDVQFHSVPLLIRQLPTHLLFLVVPKVSCDVFRQAKVESLPDLAVPAGPIDVYVAHDYLATTQLRDVAPGEAFTLGLGVEQSVKVVRNTTFKETTAGMMGSTAQLRHEVVVEAANQLSREVRLEVQDSLPQPAADVSDIKVKVESCEPAWEPIPDQNGAYRWALRIPAGENRKAQLVYLIEMGSKLELVGGNRREE